MLAQPDEPGQRSMDQEDIITKINTTKGRN